MLSETVLTFGDLCLLFSHSLFFLCMDNLGYVIPYLVLSSDFAQFAEHRKVTKQAFYAMTKWRDGDA